jgi:16S rRNA A1518/A1519 N6-dimethyltransferase RsmA/KsgA/DIM1 with predicted DNA glycosylase/AP lyase activity
MKWRGDSPRNQRTADYGALTLRLQLHHRVEYLRKIPRTVFVPQPEVASAIVRFTPRDERQIGISDYKFFREIVKHGFSQRRKQLRNLLAADVGNWEDIASKIRAPLTARAEELSREQWIELANLIALDKKVQRKRVLSAFRLLTKMIGKSAVLADRKSMRITSAIAPSTS